MKSKKSVPSPKHRAGSRKEQVHKIFDAKGPDAARTAGLRRKLKSSTLRTWFSAWSKSAPTRSGSGAEARA